MRSSIPAASESDVPIAYDEIATTPEPMLAVKSPEPIPIEESEAFLYEDARYLEPMPEATVQSYEPTAAEEPEVFPPESGEHVGYLEPMPERAFQSPEPAAAEEPKVFFPTPPCEQKGSPEPDSAEVSDTNEPDRTEVMRIAGGSEDMELVQSETSPYESEAATILIGLNGKRYTVPVDIVNRAPSLKSCLAGLESNTVGLPDVDCDIGHTFIHYLYTGDYQTLKPFPASNLSRREIEYKRSVLTYRAAMNYGLNRLADHAKKYIRFFDDDVSIFYIIVLGRKIFPEITGDSWFATYLASKIMASFEADQRIFQREEFFEGFGEAPDFDKFLGKVMANAYSQQVSSTKGVTGLRTSKSRLTVMKEGSLASNDTTLAQRVRDELTLQPRNPARSPPDMRIPSSGDDMWVDCEDDGNSIQVKVMTPSSSVEESPGEVQARQASSRALQQSALELDNRLCPLWLQHSMDEIIWKRCPKCKSHMVSMFAKLLLNDAE